MKQFTLWCALACAANAATAQNRPSSSDAPDTLRLSRRQAITTALIANPQLDIAREMPVKRLSRAIRRVRGRLGRLSGQTVP